MNFLKKGLCLSVQNAMTEILVSLLKEVIVRLFDYLKHVATLRSGERISAEWSDKGRSFRIIQADGTILEHLPA